MNSSSNRNSGRSNAILIAFMSVCILLGTCTGVLIARQFTAGNSPSDPFGYVFTQSIELSTADEPFTEEEIAEGESIIPIEDITGTTVPATSEESSVTSVTVRQESTSSVQTSPSITATTIPSTKPASTTAKPTDPATTQAPTSPPVTEAQPQIPEGAFANRFYYPRLTQSQQEIYRAAYAAASKGENSFSFTSASNDYSDRLKAGLYAFVYDFPEFISIRTGYNSVRTGSIVTVTFKTWGFAGSTPSSFIDAVDRKASNIAAQAKAYSSDYERIKFVHDYLCKNNSYDYTAAAQPDASYANQQAHTAYGALINGRSVCEGYAKSFVIIMHKLGYECGYISGKGNGGNHSWNIIRVGGQYYYIDITWDDQTDNSSSENIKYDYFCITTAEISADHTLGGSYSYPAATSHDLNYYYRNGYVMDSYDFLQASEILRKQAGNPYYCLKFTNKSAYSAAYADIKNLASVARVISGSSSCRYYYDEETYTLRFINPNY